MKEDFSEITIEQICNMIDLLNPCTDDHLYVYDFENDFYYISPHAVERFPLPGNHFHNVVETHGIFVYPPDIDELQNDLELVLSGEKDFHNMQYRWVDKNGNPVWINCRGHVAKNSSGKSMYMIGCINEIGTSRKADNVSGLLGESSLQTYIQDFYSVAPGGYLLRLGLDNFKEINEKLGIEYGDMILKKAAECISECITPGQKLFRIVADEFVVLDFLGGTLNEASALYNRIRQSINHFVENNQYEAFFTISGGILECSSIDDISYSSIMKLSEFALNEAKRQGRNRYYIFKHEDYDRFSRKKRLTRILRQAVRNDFEGFEAYFQPLFYANNSTLYGAETLMRFNTPEYGMVSPGEFIPILEETGLIIPAGRWIMHQALDACKKIREQLPDFRISINVSYIQVMKSDIITEIATAITEYGISPSNVVIELTESGLLESDSRFIRLWSLLKDRGIHLALDDFGTGYSNFQYLYDLKPDIIKIDRSFTVKALTNEYDYNLLSLMSTMVHNLNLKICIEGIETEEERVKILEISPDYSQGFYFGRPCPYQQFRDNFVLSQA